MQLYALDQKGNLVFAPQAQRRQNYKCLECNSCVRLRGGLHRQDHFYHLEPNRQCRQHRKGMVHLQVQAYVQKALPPNSCYLEYPFPTIKRIADVAWFTHRIVFEVQCASIAAEEVLQRNRDYRQMGWQVVWILHDERYNKETVTAAEWALRSSSHYFTNINVEGQGFIYDQFSILHQGKRLYKQSALPLDIAYVKPIDKLATLSLLKTLQERQSHWPHTFKGDLWNLSIEMPGHFYLDACLQAQQHYQTSHQDFPKRLYRGLMQIYQTYFQLLLEKACR